MASNKKPKKEEEEAEKNNNNNDKNKKKRSKQQLQSAGASKSADKKTPTKTNQDKKNGKKTNNVRNGKAREHELLIIPSSSCESQEVEESGGEEREESMNGNAAKNSRTQKSNQRKGKENDENEEEGEDGTMCRFPIARIKRIIKSEDPSLQLGQDVVFLVNKATEKFLEQFCEDAYQCSVRDRKKSLGYKHLSSVVSKKRRLDFLSDFVPEKLKAEDALAERKLAETGKLVAAMVPCSFLSTDPLNHSKEAAAPAPPGPINVTKILEKGGQFTIFIRLLKATQEDVTLNGQLNNSNDGVTIFAPSDNAFSSLKAGSLNALNDQQKSELVQFHIIPQFLSSSQFQTISNPLRTQAGTGSRLELNVTSAGNTVNVTTGLTNTSVSGTVYTDKQLAVYQVDKVLLPLDIFAPKPPAPAPAPEKTKKKASAAEGPVAPEDTSGAMSFIAHHHSILFVVGVFGTIFSL